MQPLIGVTAAQILKSGFEWAPAVYGQAHTYTDALARAGAAPFILPILNDQKLLRRLYEQCQGLLLAGGEDIDPALYGAKRSQHIQVLAPSRDSQELQLLRWALEDDKPVLGICRGMQLINVAAGGSLHQHILDDVPGTNDHEQSAHKQDFGHLAHTLNVEPNTKLARILKAQKLKTNALHHQAINKLGDGVRAAACAEDGIIEAIEATDKKFVVGVQSHPEALPGDIKWQRLFQAFIKAATP